MMKNLVEESLRAYQLSIAQLPNAFVAEDEQVLLISSGVQLKKRRGCPKSRFTYLMDSSLVRKYPN